jgi:hypothetical protein
MTSLVVDGLKNIGYPMAASAAANTAVACLTRYVPIPTQGLFPAALLGGIHGGVTGIGYDMLHRWVESRLDAFLKRYPKLQYVSAETILKGMALALGTIGAVGLTPVLSRWRITYSAALCFGLFNLFTSYVGLRYSTRPVKQQTPPEESPPSTAEPKAQERQKKGWFSRR